MNRSLELRQKRAQLIADAGKIVTKAADEKRSITAEEDVEYNKIFDEAESTRKTIEAEERQQNMTAELAARRSERREATGNPDGSPEEAEQRKAFINHIRLGVQSLSDEQRSLIVPANASSPEFRAQGVASAGIGGVLVPQGFYANVIAALKYYGGMFQANTKKLTTANGANLPVPTANDTGNVGAILAENTQVTEVDVAFSSVTLFAWKYTSNLVLLSYELLQDAGVDIEDFITSQFAIRLGRIMNTHFTVGTGSNQPRGVVLDAGPGKVGPTGETTSITYNDLIDTKYAVDKAYRERNAQWMFNDSTMRALLKLVDSTGRPLFYSYTGGSLQAGEPDILLGSQVIINNDMPVMAAGAKSLLFGDFSNYWIRMVEAMMMLRLTERYADYAQVGFLAFMRADGRTVAASSSSPIVYFQNSAT